ncbi:hypothetical protein OBK28_12070 [Empedobacter falsenii]
MSKKNNVQNGSALERIILFSENSARETLGLKPILSEKEVSDLANTFVSEEDIMLWNKFKNIDSIVVNAITNIQGLLFEVKMHQSNLRAYILVWNTIENAELLSNSILHQIKSEKKRIKISNEATKGIDLLFSNTRIDKEGYLDLKIEFPESDESDLLKKYSLKFLMENVKSETESTIIKFLSWDLALRDYMKKQSFKVKTYENKLNEMKSQVLSPIVGWGKYEGDLYLDSEDISFQRIKDILKQYSISPDISKVDIDNNQYNWFKRNILRDE